MERFWLQGRYRSDCRGRTTVLMTLTMKNDRYDCAAGIDIGGTNTVIGLVDRSGRILWRDVVRTAGYDDAGGLVLDVSRRLEDAAARCGVRIAGIGIGAPCADGRSGEIEAATDLPWPSPIPLARMMEAASGLPVKIANDANAATAGDMRYGVSRGLRDIIFLTLGTGVGSGIVCDGKLVEGQRGFAGELGHVKAWRSEGRRCACGREDCLQTYCSAKGVVATALRFLESGRESSLRGVPAGSLTSRDVAEAAHGGDMVAREVLRFTGEVLGEACAQFAAFTDPEAIVLFGGVARAGSFLTDAVKEAFERNVLSLYKGRVRFLVSDLGEADVALLGAAALGWEASGNDF